MAFTVSRLVRTEVRTGSDVFLNASEKETFQDLRNVIKVGDRSEV